MSTLTMQDIADLAKVSRPAVSQWRKRPIVRGESLPFPVAVSVVGGVEHFDHAEIVEWLERTGRGRNRAEQRLDVDALAIPQDVVFDDVMCLLALYALSGVDLGEASHETLTAAAEQVDPDDQLILREVKALSPTPNTLRFTGQLIDASLGTPDALTRLERGRLGRSRGVRDLTTTAMDLVRALVGAVMVHLGDGQVSIAAAGDPTPALACADLGTEFVVAGNTDAARDLRRRAAITRVNTSASSRAQRVVVASFTGSGVPEVLDAVDALLLDLSGGDVAVIMAPAAALADHLAGDLQLRRSETLKIGSLLAALRLPRGLWREAHRQSQALWICQGGADSELVGAADLDSFDVEALGDLAADVTAILDRDARRAHRFVRGRKLMEIRSSGTVVPRGTSAPRLRSRALADHADRVHQATLQTSAPARTVDVLITSSSGRFRTQDQSLAELVERKLITVRSGSRVDEPDTDPRGTVVVLPEGRLRLDPFDAAQRYPRARRTDPGDIVFVEKPAPRAVIDPVGGSLVGAPAKLLRIDPRAPFGPHVLAAIINSRCDPGTEWQTWRVPGLTAAESEQLERVLADVADYQRAVEQKVTAAKELTMALIDGVAAGDISLDTSETTFGISAITTTAAPR
ncbi:hypothetical protein O0V02_08555 [Gordonia amicalis]|uniref:hypothetical protein n=1 Tax=Gordonia amicalis TaxID=89053 RepID=UPI0022A7695E|nr:hypothetical protein [Gordonia amicalis]MCZ0912463.1 hypothetical protein [Gordonia amicalis]